MRHRLPEIVAFLQVVETGSISAAAERLNLAKSVVSKRISDLETAIVGRRRVKARSAHTLTPRGSAPLL